MMIVNPYRFGAGAASPPYVAIVGPKAAAAGAQSVAIPSGYAVGDLLLLIIQTSNESVAAPSGWTEVGTYTGTGSVGSGSASSCGMQVFYKYAVSSEPAASLPDNIRHTQAVILVIRGMATSGAIGATAATATGTGATVNMPTITTGANNALVLMIGTDAYNSASNPRYSAWTCAGLSSITEIVDYGANVGAGNFGGIGVASAIKYTAGATGAGTATLTGSCASVGRFIEINL